MNIFRNLNTKRCSFQGDYYSLKDATTIKTPFFVNFFKMRIDRKKYAALRIQLYFGMFLWFRLTIVYIFQQYLMIIPISCNCWRQTGQTYHWSVKNKIKCRNTQRDKKLLIPVKKTRIAYRLHAFQNFLIY